MLEWHEVTLKNRPPQNKLLFWASYLKTSRADGRWIPMLLTVGRYRFGFVKGIGGMFSIPSKNWVPAMLDVHRFFWAEIEGQLPHAAGLIGPVLDPSGEVYDG